LHQSYYDDEETSSIKYIHELAVTVAMAMAMAGRTRVVTIIPTMKMTPTYRRSYTDATLPFNHADAGVKSFDDDHS
jgi:hypothetical protein